MSARTELLTQLATNIQHQAGPAALTPKVFRILDEFADRLTAGSGTHNLTVTAPLRDRSSVKCDCGTNCLAVGAFIRGYAYTEAATGKGAVEHRITLQENAQSPESLTVLCSCGKPCPQAEAYSAGFNEAARRLTAMRRTEARPQQPLVTFAPGAIVVRVEPQPIPLETESIIENDRDGTPIRKVERVTKVGTGE